jgi:hypothetical protein
MNEFYNPDWNLAQVAAWVVYREAALVNQLDNPGQHDFGAIGLHKTMWFFRRYSLQVVQPCPPQLVLL